MRLALLLATRLAVADAEGGDDSKCYTNRYPDICKSFCSSPGQCDIKKAFEHFHHGAGQAEGRIWGCGRGDGKTPTSGECPGTLTATAPRHYKGTEHVPGGPARKVPTPIVVPPELGPVPESWPVRVVGGLDCSLPRWGANATTANGKTLALFAYNFGNFRNEIAAFSYFRDYKGWTHRYFFTNTQYVKVAAKHVRDGWVVCGVPDDYIPKDAFPKRRPRSTPLGWELTKWFKFGHVPEILKAYDYIQHMDSSHIGRPWGARTSEYGIPSLQRVGQLLRNHPNHDAFFVSHPARQHIPQEWSITVRIRMEQKHLVCAFEKAMRAKFGDACVNGSPMASLGQWIRKVKGVSEGLDSAFRDTFHALTSFGLKRDQNVFFFAVFNRLGNGTASAVKLCARKFPADTCPDLPTVGLRAVRGSGGALDAPPFDEAHYRCRRRRASRSWPLNFMRWGERRRSAGA